MIVLIVGGSGFLGCELVRQALAAGHRVAATYLTRPAEVAGASWYAVDVRDRQQVADVVAEVGPHVVLNAAFQQTDWGEHCGRRRPRRECGGVGGGAVGAGVQRRSVFR